MPLTVGTAGHIDHGKTWLVRALTGKDTDRLPEEQAQIIQMHYGLDGYVPHSQPEIAKRFGLTKQRISQLEIAALVWLRQPAHSQELRSLLARHDQAQYELADRLAQEWLRRRGERSGRH